MRELTERLATLLEPAAEQALAMPASYYTCAEFLALERESLFRRQWICVGHVGELPGIGDYFTTELVDEPLLVVRDRQGAIRVLSNVCRHRGNLLARGSGTATRWVCSYHAWSYALDGRLLGAPYMQEVADFDAARCRLPSFPTEIWQGFIFVNLSGDAAPLAPGLADTEPHLRHYHLEQRAALFCAEEVWRTNWKCVVENFMEGYHLSATHPNTLHAITPTSRCEKLPDGAAFTGYRANFAPRCPERGPYHPDLSEQERRSDVFYCVYPSFVVGVCPDYSIHMCVRPLSVDSTAIRWGISGTRDDGAAARLQPYLELCRAFCAEDRVTLERLQQGLSSRYYRPGPLGPERLEGTVRDLYRYAARRLGAPRSQPCG